MKSNNMKTLASLPCLLTLSVVLAASDGRAQVAFSNVTASVAPGLPGVFQSSVAWGDYDNDGRLDFLITGANGRTPISQL